MEHYIHNNDNNNTTHYEFWQNGIWGGQDVENTPEFRLSHFMKKSLALIQSAYFFSILFFSSSMVFLLLHSIKPNFSASSLFSVLTFTIDRNHMFLLCNGILVILVKSSSSSSSSPPQPPQDSKIDKSVEDNVGNHDQQKVIEFLGSERKMVSESLEQSFVDENAPFSTTEENVTFFYDHDHQDEVFYDDDDDEEEEEDGLAAEELNKRCEDFIRRMKQGIISESRKDHC